MSLGQSSLPTSKQFQAWAKHALDLLGLSPSNLMRDERDSSKNKARAHLFLAKQIKLDPAKQIIQQLHEIADEKQIDIGVWSDFDESGHSKLVGSE